MIVFSDFVTVRLFVRIKYLEMKETYKKFLLKFGISHVYFFLRFIAILIIGSDIKSFQSIQLKLLSMSYFFLCQNLRMVNFTIDSFETKCSKRDCLRFV